MSRLRRLRTPVLAAAATVLVGAGSLLSLGAGAGGGPMTVEGASLEWALSEELNTGAFDGSCNHLSAGRTDGSAAAYTGTDGDVTVLKRTAGGSDVVVSDWASRCLDASGTRVTAGGSARLGLRVRLTGGDGTHDPASGATTVRWSGTISANLYDELVPTWFSDLTLSIDDAGSGTLSATVAGYASSLENPDVRQEVPPIPGVVIARFRTTGTGPGPMTVTPDYLGVRYESTAAPQVRTTPSWGAWPPAMVAAMERTGTAAYWYSTGSSSDTRKVPAPITFSSGSPTGPTTTVPTTTTAPTTAPSTTTPPTTAPSTTTPPTTAAAPTTAGDATVLAAPSNAATSPAPRTPRSSTSSTGPSTLVPGSTGATEGTPLAVVTADPGDTAITAGSAADTTSPATPTARTADAALRYSAMSATYQRSWNPASPGSVRITYEVENVGDVTVAARGHAEVSTSIGPTGPDAAVEVRAIAPGRSRTVEHVLNGVWPGFAAAAVVELEPYVPAEPGVDLASATITAHSSAPAWPWPQILLLAALAATAVLAVGRVRRRRPTGAPTDPAHRPEENLP
ncbi:MAG: hypothetical protein H6516_03180 [Microthrixaceae bacterium]|nr:hypothetical protein [Microthrixaceae bacterium]